MNFPTWTTLIFCVAWNFLQHLFRVTQIACLSLWRELARMQIDSRFWVIPPKQHELWVANTIEWHKLGKMCQISLSFSTNSFEPLKVRFEGEKQKDMADEGIIKTLIHGRKEQRDSGFLKWLLVEFIVLDSRPVNLIVTAAKFSNYLSRVLFNKTYEANSC